MTVLAFIFALCASYVVFEILSRIVNAQSKAVQRLDGGVHPVATLPQRNALHALLIAAFPKYFDSQQADSNNVEDLLRRAGYPYDTPGEFYAASVRIFTQYLIVGVFLASALALAGAAFASPFIAAFYVYAGLRAPYSKLKRLARKRAEGMLNNMLIALTTLEALLAANSGVQEAMRRVAELGGPFCNLLQVLLHEMDINPAADIVKSLDMTRQHLPDPNNVEVMLFLQDVENAWTKGFEILDSLRALRVSLHQQVVEGTEGRAAIVSQRSSLFGGLAVLGMVASLVLPYFL